ncbi:SGNH/GDSL hydrolase family protein [Sabulicella rubraurantiaca]|uniref:SGNH/GDSL hydrolase family protein n=1 Tax=Sabulicella rubraurantiaca TaxID=2811429 RepID=UPI001A9712E0|nr:GDSL-type esterase/lipase family protein [Sabulicella rubraurantiaca]
MPLLFLGLLSGPALAAPCAPAGVQLPAIPALASALERGSLTIVAFGSSSTEGAGASSAGLAYPALLEERLRLAWPGVALRVVNAGRSGETSAEMLARMERDVLAERPDLVIWQAGGNEALRGREPAEFAAVMRQGLDRLQAAGIPVVLMDNQTSPRLAARGPAFDAELGRLGAPVFRRSAAMRAWAERGENALISSDALHLNDRGYACLAGELSAALRGAAGDAWQRRAIAAQRRP